MDGRVNEEKGGSERRGRDMEKEGLRVRKRTSDPQSRGERRLCVGGFCMGEQPC